MSMNCMYFKHFTTKNYETARLFMVIHEITLLCVYDHLAQTEVKCCAVFVNGHMNYEHTLLQVHYFTRLLRGHPRYFSNFYRATAMPSAVYAVVVCLCVCVCLSHSGIVSKRLNVGSRK